MAKNTERKAIDKVFILLGIMATVVLLGASAVAYAGYKFANNQVTTELARQNIYFPPKGSPALDPETYPDLQKYAGEQVDTGAEAKAYANGFIGRHLQHVADGKTYAEVSAEAMKDPDNAELQKQKTTLFQGEMLRGSLLGFGYGFWVFGQIALVAAVGALAGALFMAVLVMLGFRHLRKLG